MADDVVGCVEQAVARQLLLGLRESLTIAGQLGRSVEVVNEALISLRDACEGCIALRRPYPDPGPSPRWAALAAGGQPPPGADRALA